MNQSRIYKYLILFTISVTITFFEVANAQFIKNSLNEDSVEISFQGYFNYDVAIIYINGVRVFEDILYTNSSTGNSYNKKNIIYEKSDSISIKLLIFERDHKKSLEYNSLWRKWTLENDYNYYYPPKVLNKTIYPNKQGKYIGIEYLQNSKNEKYPKISTSRVKFKYD